MLAFALSDKGTLQEKAGCVPTDTQNIKILIESGCTKDTSVDDRPKSQFSLCIALSVFIYVYTLCVTTVMLL